MTPQIAEKVFSASGDWLKYAMVLGGAASSYGMLVASVCTSSRAIYAMGWLGLIPKVGGSASGWPIVLQ